MLADLIHKVLMWSQNNDLGGKKKKNPHMTFSVFSFLWALRDRAILALRGLKFNIKVVKIPLCQHCKTVNLLLCVLRTCVRACVCVCATTESPGKSSTSTGTLGDTWDKIQPGEAVQQHSS